MVMPFRSTIGAIRPESVSTSGTGGASVEAHRTKLAAVGLLQTADWLSSGRAERGTERSAVMVNRRKVPPRLPI